MSEFRKRFEALRALEEKLSDVQRIELNRRFDYALAIAKLRDLQFGRYVKDEEEVKSLGKMQWWAHRMFWVFGLTWLVFSRQPEMPNFEYLPVLVRDLFYLDSFWVLYLFIRKALAKNRLEVAGRTILDTRCMWDSVAHCYPIDEYTAAMSEKYPSNDYPVAISDRKQMCNLELRAALIGHISDSPKSC